MMARMSGGKARRGWRPALRVAGWNAALLVTGLAVIAAVGEIYLRATASFVAPRIPRHFVPGVGYIHPPGAEIRHTNNVDFWTVSRANSLGFADREPVSPVRAAASCHVTAIGDSFVAALEVPVADKFHVRLEALARRELPQLDVTTSAFGYRGVAPVNELAFYDRYARPLQPRLVVLVLGINDLWGNSPLLRGRELGMEPDRLPYVSVQEAADGTLTLLPPDPTRASRAERVRAAAHVIDASYFLSWSRHSFRQRWPHLWATGLETLRLRRRRSDVSDAIPPLVTWNPAMREQELAPAFREALELLGFALDQFVERTRRDGAALAILATHEMGRRRGDRAFDRLQALAAARGIPVIEQRDHILRRGGKVVNARWPHDVHWSPAGHQWAAEALLEHLRRNPAICGARGTLPARTAGG